MRVDKTRIGLAALLTLLVFGVLALLYWDFIREAVVIPIYYMLWMGNLVLNAIPQGVYLGVLILISMMIAVNTLRKVPGKPAMGNRVVPPRQSYSNYQQWKSLCEKMHISQFSRDRFQSDARRLALSIIAYEQGISNWEAEALVKNGSLAVPEGIRQLVERQDVPTQKPSNNRLRNVFRRLGLAKPSPRNPQLDSMVAEFIAFIEQHGESTYGGHRPQS